jgi:hypothetical protein
VIADGAVSVNSIDPDQLAHVDSVELKFVVPDGEQRVAVGALGSDLLAIELRQAYYVDTPDLALLRQGIVLRARRRQRGAHDTAIKLRPVVPAELPEELRDGPGFNVELDIAPGLSVYTATQNGARTPGRLEAALSGRRPLHELFSKRQRALLSEWGRDEIDGRSLRALGPVDVFSVATRVPQLGLRLVAQSWRYPDDSSLLELSTRVGPHELQETSARLWMFLSELGFDVATEQETKADRTLAFFARFGRGRL